MSSFHIVDKDGIEQKVNSTDSFDVIHSLVTYLITYFISLLVMSISFLINCSISSIK